MPFFEGQMFPVLFIGQLWVLQLNEYETDPHFLQFFQSNTTVCLTIYVFSKIFECKCEPEIVLFWFLQQKQFWRSIKLREFRHISKIVTVSEANTFQRCIHREIFGATRRWQWWAGQNLPPLARIRLRYYNWKFRCDRGRTGQPCGYIPSFRKNITHYVVGCYMAQ